jgi:hypothetical protein
MKEQITMFIIVLLIVFITGISVGQSWIPNSIKSTCYLEGKMAGIGEATNVVLKAQGIPTASPFPTPYYMEK